LIKALVGLPNSVALSLAGDGPEKQALEQLALHLGVGDRVHFLGTVAPERVPTILKQADMFVFPSISEGRPNAVLEAMAAGVPCLASDIDGVRELLGKEERGLLFPVGDPVTLATRIQELSGDPGRRARLGRAGRDFVRSRGLVWPEIGKAYALVYREALDSKA
jgi:glycosyltransferase involved in cell wall biosynthesis